MSNLELASWATATSSTNRYRSNNSLYHYKHVIDGDPDTFWISANNTDETIVTGINGMPYKTAKWRKAIIVNED